MHLSNFDNILPELMLWQDPAEDCDERVEHEVDEDEKMEYDDWRNIS